MYQEKEFYKKQKKTKEQNSKYFNLVFFILNIKTILTYWGRGG